MSVIDNHKFQSTHPCGVRLHERQKLKSYISRFNPRTPAGCDMRSSRRRTFVRMFQSTHPCGVRPHVGHVSDCSNSFQSTHPCGVRPAAIVYAVLEQAVSIHAPLRGATQVSEGICRHGAHVSIHAPLRGATNCPICGKLLRESVSIHAPLRGATLHRRGNLAQTGSFNPRTPAGCDAFIAGYTS